MVMASVDLRSRLLVAVLLSLVFPGTAWAGGAERVLVHGSSTPQATHSRGSWSIAPGSVGPTRRMPSGSFWLGGGEGARLVHGMVRARFTHGRRLDLTLLLRASLDRRSRRVQQGLAVRVRGRHAWLARVRRGVPQRLGGVRKLNSVANRTTLELVVSMFGKQVVVSVHHRTPVGRHFLGLLSGSHAPGAGGGVGLMTAGRNADPHSPLVHLATREACREVPAAAPGAPFFTVELPEADSAKATALAPGVRQLERLDGPPRHVYRTCAAGLERLHCDGRTLLGLNTMLPWKYVDLAYLEHRNRPPEKTETGFRIDRSVKNPRMVEALLRGWHARYPGLTRLRKIGHSRQGRPLWALAIGAHGDKQKSRPAVLLNGAHHGSEVFSVEFVLDAIQVLLERSNSDLRVKRWLEQLVVWCVPLVNPDGLAGFLNVSRLTGRKNGHGLRGKQPRRTGMGVDLNRNYPFHWGVSEERASKSRQSHKHYRGPSAGSEPETRAMMSLARRERFVASISFHTGTVAVLAPYTINGVKNPKPNLAWSVAEQIVAKLAPHPQKLADSSRRPRVFEVKRKLYSVEGTDQDWLRHTHGTLALLVEGAHWTPLDLQMRQKLLQTVRPTWQLLLDRFLDGPSISGRVAGPRGRPVRAVVRIREVKTRENERWTTRRRDGRFDRFLPAPGVYHVEVKAPGHRAMVQRVRVHKGKRAQLWIRLKK